MMVTDVQFETMGVAVGQVATVRAKLSEESTNLDSKGTIIENNIVLKRPSFESMVSLWLLYKMKTN